MMGTAGGFQTIAVPGAALQIASQPRLNVV